MEVTILLIFSTVNVKSEVLSAVNMTHTFLWYNNALECGRSLRTFICAERGTMYLQNIFTRLSDYTVQYKGRLKIKACNLFFIKYFITLISSTSSCLSYWRNRRFCIFQNVSLQRNFYLTTRCHSSRTVSRMTAGKVSLRRYSNLSRVAVHRFISVYCS